MVFKYTLPVGLREYPIEVEIRFPQDLNESVTEEIKRLFLPFSYAMGSPKQDESEVEPEETSNFIKPDARKGTNKKSKHGRN